MDPNKNNTTIIITDTSVLINFLNIDRIDLLANYPGKFVITDHVAEKISQTLTIVTTQDIMVNLIVNHCLTVAEADRIKVEWENEYRFLLKLKSFTEVIL